MSYGQDPGRTRNFLMQSSFIYIVAVHIEFWRPYYSMELYLSNSRGLPANFGKQFVLYYQDRADAEILKVNVEVYTISRMFMLSSDGITILELYLSNSGSAHSCL